MTTEGERARPTAEAALPHEVRAAVVPALVDLADELALDRDVVGGKAAALARAAAAGLPTLPGVVVPVGAHVEGLHAGSPLVAALRRRLGAGPLVARSSSPLEDTAASSMAGRFESVLDLRDDASLADAIRRVARSGAGLGPPEGGGREGTGHRTDAPVAVLVQPMVHGPGGVGFGVEPVTGRRDLRLAVTSSRGPDAVVGGAVEGVRHLLASDGRLLRRDGDDDPAGRLDRARRRELAALATRAGELFGSPQDIEFLVDEGGQLRLLQSRPVTTPVRGAPQGPVYGVGPVAETFPEPLSRLERELWATPLEDGLREALVLAGLARRPHLEGRPLVVHVAGRVAVDLDLVDPAAPGRWARWLDLRPKLRRARGAWRVGRLRAALPALAHDLVREADDALAAVGPLVDLSDRQLLGVLHRTRDALRSLHGHEVLMGLLIDDGRRAHLTGVAVAVRALAAARADGLDDDEVVRTNPVVLALTGPRIGGSPLPQQLGPAPALPRSTGADEPAVLREALRLRIRWVHELAARAALELGRRLVARGDLAEAGTVAALDLGTLAALVAHRPDVRPLAADLAAELARQRRVEPVPTRFRFDPDGRPVPELAVGGEGGTGAGGGVGAGPVVHDVGEVAQGAVLVVAELRPELAPALPQLAGLVAETGSPLAHLAILAREAGVPTVVGVAGAGARLVDGEVVEVDGDRGTVRTRGGA